MTSMGTNPGISEKKRSEWLKEMSAYLADDYEVTEYGKSRIKTVLFTEEVAPISILSHVWHEYDTYAQALLIWLYELRSHPNSDVRLRVAAVAGHLALYEFRPVYEKVILPWAKLDNESAQKLAALALTIVAVEEDEEIAKQSLNILERWSKLKNSYNLQWTAIAAYGSYIGLLYPQQAIENLKTIAQSGDGRLFPYIVQAVANLFDSAQQISTQHFLILKSLKEWAEPSHQSSLNKLSLIIFWGLMRESWIIKDEVRQPTLLWLAKKDKELEELIIYLMRRGLNLELTRNLILAEIFNWLKLVDKQDSLYKTLGRIIFTLASPGKEYERMSHYLRKYGKDSPTALKILQLIEKYH